MKRALIAVVLTALAIAGMTATTAFGWHAEGVTVYAECQEGTYTLSASIQGSSDIGEYVKSISPSSLPGNTHGNQSVTVVIGWANSDETQTFYRSIYLKGDCEGTTPPPPPLPPYVPCVPRNPDGSPGGKDDKPGNDDCAADETLPPLTIDTETTTATTEPPPPTTVPPVTTDEPPVTTATEPQAPPKTIKSLPRPAKPPNAPPEAPPVCRPGQVETEDCGVEGQG